MKAVAAHALGVEAVGDCVTIGHCTVAAMERGIETGDLRKIGKAAKKRANWRQIVRLVQRRERHEALQVRENFGVDSDRPVVVWAAVDDAMTDRSRYELLRFAQPRARGEECGRNVTNLGRRVRLIDQTFSVGVFGAQLWARADAVHLPFDQALQSTAPIRKYLEFDARRAGIDDQDRVHGGHAATVGAFWRRACA